LAMTLCTILLYCLFVQRIKISVTLTVIAWSRRTLLHLSPFSVLLGATGHIEISLDLAVTSQTENTPPLKSMVLIRELSRPQQVQ
jgi:hypothetical protein